VRLSDFDFDLPEDRIARFPLADRGASRMLVVRRGGGEFRHSSVALLPDELSSQDLLVLNDSRVFPARLFGEAEGRPAVEALFVRPLGGGEWLLLLRPSRRMRPGQRVRFPAAGLEGAIVRAAGEGEWVVRFPEGASVAERLERFGEIPLPPYIGRPATEEDRERYQTVYARETGSVAAPTAGLHFTEGLLAALERKGIAIARVTLHVGPGTFRPIRGETVAEHRMEPERFEVPAETAGAVRSARSRGARVVAVGTTVVRTLESAADGREVRAGAGWTDLFLKPPDELRVVDALLTNFHLPRSTLFLLVSAFAGTDTMRAAYGTAIDAGYRFYSYGDCMLIL
jgi:S-adenosylmethionine:tRNA ribosyltransferase-isomerase